MLQSGHLKYSNEECQIHLCSIEMRKPDYTFLPPDYNEVTQAITKKISLERLLKLIHYKFSDQGLTSTLIHQIYASSDNQVQYYVPELVYIAVRKMCMPMRKVLVSKSSTSESLRRLILWNIKAFTVLMIEKEENLRAYVKSFEQEVVGSAPDKKKFTDSQKAISMLANASLILKKMPKEEMKDKLKKFIKRFNHEILNNLQHCIMIPFRRSENQKVNSSYVTRIIEDNCSCFPTRKRVPYRIILETIDIEELRRHHHEMGSSNYFKQENVVPDKQRDLFDEVKTEIERLFKPSQSFLIIDNRYPFVIDQEQFVNNTKLNNFQKNIENKEKNQKENDMLNRTRQGPVLKRETVDEYMSKVRSSRGASKQKLVFNKGQIQIMDTQKYRKFCKIFIPTLPSSLRKSDSDYPRGLWITVDKDHFKKRLSQRAEDLLEQKNVKVIQEQVKYDGTTAESVWKQPWSQTVKTLKQFSPFKKMESLRFRNMVVKGGDDLRQQIICMQLIYKMQAIIKQAHVDIFIKPYEIIVLSENSGMLQFVSNSISIDGMKKDMDMTLPEFYNQVFNTEPKFLKAKDNFIRSLAGSSILTYVLKLKDRHNGNILLDIDGNIIHIDFGFILGMSPGGLNFQSSPFKFTQQYVLLLGGKDSPDYKLFVELFCDGMMALRKRCVELCLMLHIMMEQSDLECFRKFSIESFKEVFQQKMVDADYRKFCEGLVQLSCCHSRTANYDYFQKMTNGINP